jgi:hypothetical protein
MTPPKTRRKMGPVARAELGRPRECVSCGEIKEVSEKNFALSKKGTRDWHDTCRVCQGVLSAERLTKQSSVAPILAVGREDETDDLIAEMYLLTETGRNPGRADEIAKLLRDSIVQLHDNGQRKDSFRLFVKCVKPLVAGWVEPGAIHDDIIDGLISEHRRRLIIATRYSAKSTLTSIYVAWRVMLDPLIKIMVVSKGAKLAARMLRTVRHVFFANCPMLTHLKPTEDCLDNAEQFQTPQSLKVTTGGATLSSFGRGSDLPGYRSDLTIGDDVESGSDDTPEKVVDLEEQLNELHMINPKGEKIMLGTYQSEFSIYARLADKTDGDGESIWELHRAIMFEEDPDTKTVRSRWPQMFSDKDGLDWRKSVTARAWRLHAMLIADPSILNERPLKISDFILVAASPLAPRFPLVIQRTNQVALDVPTWGAPKGDLWYRGEAAGGDADYAMTVMSVDPASGLAGRDAIGVSVISVTPSGFAVIRHLEGVRGPSKGANMRRVAEIARTFKITELVVEETEEGFFGETLEGELILLDYPVSVRKVTTGQQQKGRRIIEALAPPMGAGRIVILEQVARSDHGGDFVNQMVRISYDGRTGKAKDHDDIVDALAHAIAVVKSSLISDTADNISSHHLQKLDRLRYVPLRFGGLGGRNREDKNTHRVAVGTGLKDDLSMGEQLIEEDEVLTKTVTRRDMLRDILQQDLQAGRAVDPGIARRIQSLTDQIKELTEAQVL